MKHRDSMEIRKTDVPFLETLCLQDGSFPFWSYHYRRMRRTLQEFYGLLPQWMLGFGPENLLQAESYRLFSAGGRCSGESFASFPASSKIKCRMLYGLGGWEAEFLSYEPRRVESLFWVEAPRLDYHLKYADRCVLENLRSKRASCDEILIGQDGLLTDTSYSNVVLYDGSAYYTPARCLLEGIRRQVLLDAGLIRTMEIRRRDLDRFCRVFLINALLGLEDGVCVEMDRVLR